MRRLRFLPLLAAAGASSDTCFSSTSIATAAAVNALDEEPIAKIVRSSTAAGDPTSRTP